MVCWKLPLDHHDHLPQIPPRSLPIIKARHPYRCSGDVFHGLHPVAESENGQIPQKIVLWNMGKYGKIWENMGKYGKIWENMGTWGSKLLNGLDFWVFLKIWDNSMYYINPTRYHKMGVQPNQHKGYEELQEAYAGAAHSVRVLWNTDFLTKCWLAKCCGWFWLYLNDPQWISWLSPFISLESRCAEIAIDSVGHLGSPGSSPIEGFLESRASWKYQVSSFHETRSTSSTLWMF